MSKQIRHVAHWGSFTAEVRDGRLVGVKPFEDERADLPLLQTIPDIVYAENRIAQPMVRQGYLRRGPAAGGEWRGREPFVPISWDRALDLVSGELARVKRSHGNQAIFGGSYGWSSAGRFHHARSLLRRFLYGFGGCTDQLTNYSWGAAMVFLPHVLGSYDVVNGAVTPWRSIAEHAGLVVMFGGASAKNGQVSSGGFAVNTYEFWLRRAAETGVRFVCISPIRDDAPDFLDAEWVSIRPNTDTAMMLALAHTLMAEGRHDQAFLDRYTVGFDHLERYLEGADDGVAKDADWAAEITGVDADFIRALARRMAETRTMLSATWSLQRGDHGEQPYWALIALAAMLGQIGLPGGGFGFGYGSINGIGNTRLAIKVPEMPIGANPLDLAIPVARVTDLLAEPGATLEFDGKRITYPDIRLVYWAGGNPFHHHQDLNRLIAAWRRPETVIVHEPWWTSTARFADIVLPATTTLERNDIGASSRDRFIMAMHRAVEPVGDARADFDIFAELADRLGFRDAFTEGRDEMGWLRHLYETCRTRVQSPELAELDYEMPTFDEFWDRGWVMFPRPKRDRVIFEEFRRDPAANALATPSGRIEIYSETIAAFGYDDCPPHPAWLEPAEWLGSETAARFPLHLISNQPKTRLHSQADQARVSQASKVQGREPILINPTDAASRGIADGDVVRVFNDRGACLAGAVVTDRVRAGVVQLSTGAWYDPMESGVPGTLEKHGNPNVLTLDKGTSKVGQGPSALSALVEVELHSGPVPPVSVFAPPPTSDT